MPSPARARGAIPIGTQLVTPRLILRPLRPSDVAALRRHATENAAHLRRWSTSAAMTTSLVELAKHVARARRAWREGSEYAFALFLRESLAYIGTIALTQVTRHDFQSASVGCEIDRSHEGHGLAREAGLAACEFAFSSLSLHRVTAAVMPDNARSLRLLSALGFREEGLAREYLLIGGRWENHLLFAVTAPEFAGFRPLE